MLLRFVFVFFIALFIGASQYFQFEPFHSFALRFNDSNFIFQNKAASDKVVFIGVDEPSVNRFGRWPWDRAVLAHGISQLPSESILVLDMVFSEPTEHDEILAEALELQGNNICGFFLRQQNSSPLSPEQKDILQDSSLMRLASEIKGEQRFVEADGVEANVPSILSACTLNASFSNLRERDQLFRQYPLAFSVQGDLFASIGVQAIRLQSNEDIHALADDEYDLANHAIITDSKGFARLNFYPQESFQTYSFEALYDGKIPQAALANKIIIIGITEVGVGDMRATPMGIIPGPLIHATFISNVLQEDLLHSSGMLDAFVLIVMLLLPMIWRIVPSVMMRVVIYIGSYLALFVASKLGFIWFDFYIDAFFPLMTLLLSAIVSEVMLYQANEKESKFIQDAFTAYLSPVLLKELVKEKSRLGLGGEKKMLTIFFSDIRSFTSISEAMDPQKLTIYLNRYFTPMSDIIMANKGMIDKYIGDAIMAFYNAPLDVEEHAVLACRASLEMIDTLTQLNAEFTKEGLPPIDIGIGLNTAEVVVGNMGSNQRFNYTVIGDGVNLASRVEGINKQYGTKILITEFTYAHVKEHFLTRPIEKVRVKGKEEEVLLYELLKRTDANEQKVQSYIKARTLYLEGKMKEAKQAFSLLGDDGVSVYFMNKINHEIARLGKDS